MCKEFDKAFQNPDGYVRSLKNIVGSYGPSNLIKNIFNVIDEEIPKNDYKIKIQFLQKRQLIVIYKDIFMATLKAKRIKASSMTWNDIQKGKIFKLR